MPDNFILLENDDRLLTEDGVDLLVLEEAISAILERLLMGVGT